MSKSRLSLRPITQGYILLAPALIVYLLFAVYPMIDVIRMSFSSWNGLNPQAKFVGVANYRAILTQDPVFWGAFRNTLIWTAMAVIVPTWSPSASHLHSIRTFPANRDCALCSICP
jgi:raffinose/stachyose/melibiose transport system permease protein